jgi:hypothetical protein
VHGTVGEQSQDGRADVTALASPAAATTATRATEAEAPWIEAEAPAAWAESEPALKAGSERAVATGAVLTEMFAELATGVPPLLVQCTALLRVEPEAESAGLWCEWVVHGESPYFRWKRHMRFR